MINSTTCRCILKSLIATMNEVIKQKKIKFLMQTLGFGRAAFFRVLPEMIMETVNNIMQVESHLG